MILALESSCDESALALFEPDRGLVAEWVHSQVALHQPYGGVVPEMASREHLANFPVLLEALQDRLAGRRPDLVAVTCGPGLAACLAVGIALAKSLALAWRVPLAGVNHLRAHAWSPFLGLHAENPAGFADRLPLLLPHLGLLVSGGNTVLFRIDPAGRLEVLAETVDDAAGEALDKGAKLLGFPYPGGPLIERAAAGGNPHAIEFPRAFRGSSELKFSFSGLKTSLRYRLEEWSDEDCRRLLPDICASYQEAVVDSLLAKCELALERLGPFASLGLSGGVANNLRLRQRFTALAQTHGRPVLLAHPRHTGDNAAMIAFAAWADPSGLLRPADLALDLFPNATLADSPPSDPPRPTS